MIRLMCIETIFYHPNSFNPCNCSTTKETGEEIASSGEEAGIFYRCIFSEKKATST